MTKVSPERLWEEIGFLAYYFHWSIDSLLDLTHSVRERFVAQVSKMNIAESGGG